MEERHNNKVIDFKLAKGDTETPYYSKFGNYKPDEELLQSTARIKHQRDVIKDRLNMMDTSAERVTKGVYEKVKRDYSLQMQTINELLSEKKQNLKKEVKDLYLRREKLSVEISRHREILEEAEFRNYLGEFTQAQYHEVEGFETKEIEKLESDLTRIGEFIRLHEDLLDPEDMGLPVAKPKQAVAPSTQDVTRTVAREAVAREAKPEQTPVARQEAPKPEPVKAEPARPAPKQEAPKAEAPKQAPVEEPSDITDASEFEDLFLDDEGDHDQKLSESRSKINKIIDDVVTTTVEEPTKDDDYFNEQSLNDSLTIKKGEFTPHDETTPKPDKLSESLDQDLPKPEAKVVTSQPARKATIDDSISDILNSIQIEDGQSPTPVEQTGKVAAAPAAQLGGDTYHFTLIEGDLDQKEYVLKDNTSIGRSPSNDIVLKAPKVSRQHAAVNMYNNQFIIIDLKSSNGVYVNGTKVDECVLNAGDEVSVGGYKFLFHKIA